MAENGQQEEEIYSVIPIEWHFPENVKPHYASNFIVQHTAHEFYLSFFILPPPIILGTAEERQAQAKEIKSARAEAVARVVIAADRLPEFIEALQENLKNFQKKFKEDSEE
jgi:hypothetical protein